MLALKSVAKPRPKAGLESLETAAQPAKTRPAGAGDASDSSRSAKHLIKRGKGEPIHRQLSDSVGLESIIGIDDRTRILDTDLAPWRMICALRMQSPTGSMAMGTGWLVGPRTIITAGHCVYSQHFFGGWAQRIEVTPGRNGQDFPFGQIVVADDFEAIDRWVEAEEPDVDVGVVHLDRDIGNTLGWFGLASLPATDLQDSFVNISGYPGDRGAGTEQYFHSNRVKQVTDRRVFYDVDTFGGQSGAPVWVYEDGSDDPIVVGIHAYGTGGTPSGFGILANSAPRIIPEIFDLIQGWIDNGPSG